jgi:hypothetical protein
MRAKWLFGSLAALIATLCAATARVLWCAGCLPGDTGLAYEIERITPPSADAAAPWVLSMRRRPAQSPFYAGYGDRRPFYVMQRWRGGQWQEVSVGFHSPAGAVFERLRTPDEIQLTAYPPGDGSPWRVGVRFPDTRGCGFGDRWFTVWSGPYTR